MLVLKPDCTFFLLIQLFKFSLTITFWLCSSHTQYSIRAISAHINISLKISTWIGASISHLDRNTHSSHSTDNQRSYAGQYHWSSFFEAVIFRSYSAVLGAQQWHQWLIPMILWIPIIYITLIVQDLFSFLSFWPEITLPLGIGIWL